MGASVILLAATGASSTSESWPEMPVARHVATRMAAAGRLDVVSKDADATAKRLHVITSPCKNPRFAFSDLGGKGYLLRASIRIGAVAYRLTFDGLDEATVAPNSTIESDPVPVWIRADTTIETLTYTLRDSTWVGTWQGQLPSIDWEAVGAGDQSEPGARWEPTGTENNSRGPVAMYADTVEDHRALAIVGDSISALPGTWTTNVALASEIAWQSASVGGQNILSIMADKERRFGPLALAPFTHHICQHGTNDSGGTVSVFPWQSYIDYWTWAAEQGVKVIQATQTPHTSSTDGWTTLEGQTRINWPKREAFNQWLRDGAPIIDGEKAEPGATGALRVGEEGHPLHAVFDAGAAVESSLGSGLWRTDIGSIAGDGLHPSALGGTAVSNAFPMALLA